MKNNKGITLIALVITIIVMLILVGVTISMAVNGGLFNYAGQAVRETNTKLQEEGELAEGGIEVNEKWYNTIDEYLDEIRSENQNGGTEVSLISFTIDGVSYQAEEGMRWDKWVSSSYNTGEWACDSLGVYLYDYSHGLNNYVYDEDPLYEYTNGAKKVVGSDPIISEHLYYKQSSNGGTN